MRKKIEINSRAFATYASAIVRINGALSFKELLNRHMPRADVLIATRLLSDKVTLYVETHGMGDTDILRMIELAIARLTVTDTTGLQGAAIDALRRVATIASETVLGTAAEVRDVVRAAAQPTAAFTAGAGIGAIVAILFMLLLLGAGRGR